MGIKAGKIQPVPSVNKHIWGIAQLGAPATVCDDPSTRGNDNLVKTPETQ